MRLDFMRHAPGGFVGDGQLALDLTRGHALVAGAKEKHDVEPVLQRRAAAGKRCPRFRVNVEGAPLADKSLLLAQAMKLAHARAFRAVAGIAEAELKQVIETGVFRGKALRENAVEDGFGVGCGHGLSVT